MMIFLWSGCPVISIAIIIFKVEILEGNFLVIAGESAKIFPSKILCQTVHHVFNLNLLTHKVKTANNAILLVIPCW